MINVGDIACPDCGGNLVRYGTVRRIIRTKNRETHWVIIKRRKCSDCGKIHRELPEFIFPYKQYEAEVIRGVIEGFITCETIGYEDYPCELTMKNWISQKMHLPL